MSRGLSELQKAIIQAIANATINSNGCDTYWEHTAPHAAEPSELIYSRARELAWEIRTGLGWHLGEAREHYQKRKAFLVSFSRAVHTLIKKGLVGAVALAWVEVPSGNFVRWQGGGRYEEGRWSSPRIRTVYLTEVGWKMASAMMGAEVGKCSHQNSAD